MRLSDLAEDRLLARILPTLPRNRGVVAGAGDDCAVVRIRGCDNLLLLKSDCVVEGVHFESAALPEQVGWKAMMRSLSDFAAMSGCPEFALITLAISRNRQLQWVRRLYRGLARAASRFRVAIVGGETSEIAGPTTLVVSAVGYVERNRCVLRSGGKPGDDLFVTGNLGGSLNGTHLTFVPRITESRWLTEHFPVHALIDLSDGLGTDLPRLAQASKVGFEIERERLPVSIGCTIDQAISDGEDYELLFAIAARFRRRLEKSWRETFPKIKLTRIGRLVRRSPAGHAARTGNERLASGYVHFKQRPRD